MQSLNQAVHISVGESITRTIKAREHWNDTDIIMAKDETYHFKASGNWKDLDKSCCANGYESTNILLCSTERLRRVATANWFALIGAIDHNEQSFFLIGNENTISIPQGGNFSCFANDVIFMYWNNCGELELTIERVI
jgi:hypothetical protein